MRRTSIVIAFIVGAYFVVRAVVEVATIDYRESSSYRHDWGGPSLAGVLTVHCLPGLISLLAMAWGWRRIHTRAER